MQVNLFPRSAKRPVRAFFAFTLLGVAVLYASEHANAQQSASVAISVKDHRFQPSQITAPANRPISIKVKNLDTAPMNSSTISINRRAVLSSCSDRMFRNTGLRQTKWSSGVSFARHQS